MRHGKKLAKLPGRNPGQKSLHLRNLVSSLLHHEMIVTTQARAKYTAKKAEKMILKGKRATPGQVVKAQAFFLKPHFHSFESRDFGPVPPPLRPTGYPEIPETAMPGTYERPFSLMSKVFITLAERYKERRGGFTRILNYGRRESDKAKMAIVCLVDGPKDLKPEILARTIGRKAVEAEGLGNGSNLLEGNVEEWGKYLNKKQMSSLQKYLKYRDAEGKAQFEEKVKNYADIVVAEALTQKPQLVVNKKVNPDHYTVKAGERLSGTSSKHSALSLARGLLRGPGTVMGKHKRTRPEPIENVFLKKAGSAKMASAQDL